MNDTITSEIVLLMQVMTRINQNQIYLVQAFKIHSNCWFEHEVIDIQ